MTSDPTLITTPFAAQGDTKTIPNEDASSVNWATGFTANYSKKITEAGAKLVSRKELNGILNAITKAIRYIQIGGVAAWNNTFQTSFEEGSIIWKKKDDGYWYILEANRPSPRNPDNNPGDWNWYTLAQYANNKAILKNIQITDELNVGGENGITLKSGAAKGCPTPVNGTDFANKQYVDNATKKGIGSDSPFALVDNTANNAVFSYTIPAEHNGKFMVIHAETYWDSIAYIDLYVGGEWRRFASQDSNQINGEVSLTFSCYVKTGLQIRVYRENRKAYTKTKHTSIMFFG